MAILLSSSLEAASTHGAVAAKVTNWHAMGSAPCVMEDQAWEKPTRPGRPLNVNVTIDYLRENGFNCYVLGIASTPPYSFSDLRRLLPQAQRAGISVWAELFPPSEPAIQLPYKRDYVRWMGTLAHLSRRYAALRGVNIDDYLNGISAKTFTRAYTCRLYEAKQAVNPNLLFVPTLYELTPEIVRRVSGCVDGVWLWWTNLGSNDGMRTILEDSSLIVGDHFAVYTGVYAHSTSWHKGSGPTPQVLRGALQIACRYSGGAVIWNLPLGPNLHPNALLRVAQSFTPGGAARLAGRCGAIGYQP
jgi:hypothetical protein